MIINDNINSTKKKVLVISFFFLFLWNCLKNTKAIKAMKNTVYFIYPEGNWENLYYRPHSFFLKRYTIQPVPAKVKLTIYKMRIHCKAEMITKENSSTQHIWKAP